MRRIIKYEYFCATDAFSFIFQSRSKIKRKILCQEKISFYKQIPKQTTMRRRKRISLAKAFYLLFILTLKCGDTSGVSSTFIYYMSNKILVQIFYLTLKHFSLPFFYQIRTKWAYCTIYQNPDRKNKDTETSQLTYPSTS